MAGLVGLETFYSRLYSAGSFFTVHNQDLEMCVFTLHSEGPICMIDISFELFQPNESQQCGIVHVSSTN